MSQGNMEVGEMTGGEVGDGSNSGPNRNSCDEEEVTFDKQGV